LFCLLGVVLLFTTKNLEQSSGVVLVSLYRRLLDESAIIQQYYGTYEMFERTIIKPEVGAKAKWICTA